MFGWSINAHLPGVHAELDDLERDTALYRLFLLRNIDRAKAAFSQLFQELVAVDDRAGAFGKWQHHSLRTLDSRLLHEAVLLKMFCQQALHAPPEQRILATSPIEVGDPFLWRGLLDRLKKDFLFRAAISCLWFTHLVSLIHRRVTIQWRNRSLKHAIALEFLLLFLFLL